MASFEEAKSPEVRDDAENFLLSGSEILKEERILELRRLEHLEKQGIAQDPAEQRKLKEEIKILDDLHDFWFNFMKEVIQWRPEEDSKQVPKEMLKQYAKEGREKLVFLLEQISELGSIGAQTLTHDKETPLKSISLLTKSVFAFKDPELLMNPNQDGKQEIEETIEEVIQNLQAARQNVENGEQSEASEEDEGESEASVDE